MKNEVQSGNGERQKLPISLVYVVLGGAALLFLLIDHWAHIFGILPYLLILACPLMHLLMHRGHGGHGKGRDNEGHTSR